MKKLNKKQLLFSLILIWLISISSAFGQSDLENAFGFGNNNNVEDEAPIHMLVYLGLAIGGYLGFKKLKINRANKPI